MGSGGGSFPAGSGGGGMFLPPNGGSSGGTGLPEGGCFATSSAAEQVVTYETVTMEVTVNRPVALYLMLDQSGSMLGNKWTAAVGAIQTFLRDPRSTDLDVAFQLFSVSFFPPSGCGLCDGSDCQVPLVPMGRLPAHAPTVEAQLLNRAPIGIGTPIEAGLRGGINFCAGFQQNSPDNERCVLVFITDGEPSNCLQDTAGLAAIAGQGFSQQNVLTYAIGMEGASFAQLDAIGQQGGTDCSPNGPGFACNVSTQDDFLAALALIRETVTESYTDVREVFNTVPVACEWEIPPAPAGEEFDATKVNVDFRAGGGAPQRIGAVPTVNDCAGVAGGWYYDNPAAPTKVLVCPQTCQTIQAISDAQVDVVFGCATEPAIVM